MTPVREFSVSVRKYAPELEKARSSYDVPVATAISPPGILRMPVTPLNWAWVLVSLPMSSVGPAESVQLGTLDCAPRGNAAPVTRSRSRFIVSVTRVLPRLLVAEEADDALFQP